MAVPHAEQRDRTESGKRPSQLRFWADSEAIQLDGVVLHPGDGIKEHLAVLSLRKGRAETLTRRIHVLFCALAAARVHRVDGWISVDEIGKLDGWSRDGATAKLLINELEPGSAEAGIVEQKGRGTDAQLRLRMPAGLVEIGELPDSVRRLFVPQRSASSTTEDHRPQPIVERELALTIAETLRKAQSDDRTLLVSPLYQGGHSSFVFEGLSINPVVGTRGEPVASSVLVKLPIGLSARRAVAVQEKPLQDESALLRELAGWPGLPVHVESVRVDLRRAGNVVWDKHRIDFRPDLRVMPALIIPMGRPRTAEAAPRLLSSVIDEMSVPAHRLSRRDIHNVLVLAERLTTLTRLFHIHKRAHRHLSVDAIVLRYELGIFEHILAADLAASVPVSNGADELLYRDLFDLGRVLVHVITGLRIGGDQQNFQPPGFPGRALLRGTVLGEGEAVAGLLFAISRYLLEASSGEGGGDPREAPTVKLLDHFLDEIEHINMRHWSQARGVPERRISPRAGGSAALAGSLSRETWTRSATDPVATRLVTISHLVPASTLRRWCERYVTSLAWHQHLTGPGGVPGHTTTDATPGDGASPDLPDQEHVVPADQCIALLRQGLGRAAASEMWKYLWRRGTTDSAPNVIRVLRNYVTHWMREQRFDVAHRMDETVSDGVRSELDALRARIGERQDGKVIVDWIDELKRSTWEAGELKRAPDADDRDRPNPKTVSDERLRAWMHAGALLRLVQNKSTPPSERDIHDVEGALRGRSAPEAVLRHIVLARAWVAAALHGAVAVENMDGESGWDKAMRALLVAAGIASSRKLPYEMATTLGTAAYLTRIALATPELAAAFSSQGVDVESVRVQAAECALLAADAYLWLDNQQRHHHELLEAARLLQGSAFPERLVQALHLLSLARNNRLLEWQPQLPAAELHIGPASDRFERYSPMPFRGDAAHLTRHEQKVQEEIREAWTRARGRVQTSDDPGLVLEHGYFSRYAPDVQQHFEAGGLQIELEKTGTARGSAVHRLFELVEAHYQEPIGRQLLDFGCGSGAEARQLARYRGGYDVWAVGAPVWFAAHRETNEDGSGARPTFIEWDPVDFAREVLGGTFPPKSPTQLDAVLFRCSLCRISQREMLLKAAFKLLKPGGIVLATDWIQTRTTDRLTWSRLLNTVRLVDLETAPGYQQLCKEIGFARFKSWGWEDMASTDEPAMHEFLQARLIEIRRMIGAERSSDRRSPYERAFLMQAQRDVETLTAMSMRDGPLGWLFWAARKDDA